MFGLTKLHHAADPETTLDKIIFLVNAISNYDHLTTIISFSALFALISMRSLKDRFKGTWWIYSIPEVFLVVVVSTSLFIFWLHWQITVSDKFLQFFPPSSSGKNWASIFLAQLT
jgi:MFS superfamily sulfate permease-like transporter